MAFPKLQMTGSCIPDAYTDGYCHRCGRKRTECDKLIQEYQKRCVEIKDIIKPK